MVIIFIQNFVLSELLCDFKFNVGKIDEFVILLVNIYVDWFGNEYYIIEGFCWLVQQVIVQFGWVFIDLFQDGVNIILLNQVLCDEDIGEYYCWDGVLLKYVDVGFMLLFFGGVGVGVWVGIGDVSL